MRLVASLITTSLCMILPAFAANPPVPLNTIDLSLSAQKWVVADTAKVTVAINAALTTEQLTHFQSNVKSHLQQLAPHGDWHIIALHQSPDQSGLQNVRVLAEARLNADAIPHLTDASKTMSQQGTHYQIANVAFSPSFEQLQATKAQLRQALYLKVNHELASINHQYAPQKFHVYNIAFRDMNTPVPRLQAAGLVLTKMSNGHADNQNVSVSQKIQMTAQVTFANANYNLPKRPGKK